jgi:hypothetical protein
MDGHSDIIDWKATIVNCRAIIHLRLVTNKHTEFNFWVANIH